MIKNVLQSQSSSLAEVWAGAGFVLDLRRICAGFASDLDRLEFFVLESSNSDSVPSSLASVWGFFSAVRQIISKTLSKIIQIQSNLQKSIALEMQTSCSYIKNKMSISFFWVVKISRIEVAQPIFFTCNLFNYFFQKFICFYCHFKACIFKTKLASGIFIWWYNVDTIQIYDRPKQILTISTILQHCESWKKAENQ